MSSAGQPGIPDGVIAAGALLPDADLLDPFGASVRLHDAGSGVTANVHRPGSVDTAMQAWIRAQPPAKIGAALHERFAKSYEEGSLITPGNPPVRSCNTWPSTPPARSRT